MRLYVFVPLLTKPGCEGRVEQALLKVTAASRTETGCRDIHAYRDAGNGRLFYVHSIWEDEADFERHADLPHTVAFIADVSPLLEHPVKAARTRLLG
jgi:quinol monooxygenase YgiN